MTKKVILGVSNRHLHLSAEDWHILFGEQILTKRNDLLQPEAFAAEQTVTLRTPKNELKNVRIIGPLRPYTQVEISQTDAYFLGLQPPIRNSGELQDAAKITLIGPNGQVERAVAILAARHLHLSPEEKKAQGWEKTEQVSVRLGGEKGLTYHHVYLKTAPAAVLELHLDTDEANAAGAKTGDQAEILD